MIANRELTPEEKRKHLEWQAAEILRRRGVNGPPSVEPGVEPEAEAAPKCPQCGTRYANPKYRRCYTCIPGSGRVRTKPVDPVKPPPRRVGLEEAFARPTAPVVVPEAEVVAVVEAEIEAPDHIADVGNMVGIIGNGKPDPIAVLRRVVDALDGLDAATAKWVLRSAAGMPRGE